MSSPSILLVLALFLAVFPSQIASENTHNHVGVPRRSTRGAVKGVTSLKTDLHDAVSAALGGGHGFNEGRLLQIKRVIQPLWASMLKNSNGRIDRRLLRYVANRYFMQQHFISMVGLEPESMNSSSTEVALLMKHAPSYVKTVLEGRGAEHGFSLEDAVGMVAALERLVTDSGRELLEDVYTSMSAKPTATLTRTELSLALKKYMIRWMVGDDRETVDILEANSTLLSEAFSDWGVIADFLEGRISTFVHQHQLRAIGSSTTTQASTRQYGSYNPFQEHFQFQDVEVITGSIATTFGRFWENECASIKESLVAMDPQSTGRIKLSTFYNTAMNGEWRFSESKEYLRQLGALDESSAWKGPQVIIPNYLQGASNCIVTAPHYRVCCAHECEEFLSELELSIGGPIGSVEQILELVDRMTVNLHDEKAALTTSHWSQLKRISEVHGGQVPLHGRLFAQWLHYVFPRECPYPHKAGVASMVAPTEFGDYLATNADMADHVAQGSRYTDLPKSSDADGDEEGGSWMSQWTHEEELLADYAHLAAPWEGCGTTLVFLLVVGIIAIVGGMKLIGSEYAGPASFLPTTDKEASGRGLPRFHAPSKEHFV